MKRLLSISFVASILVGMAHADPIEARVKLISRKSFNGEITERLADGIMFHPAGAAAAVRVPDSKILEVRFSDDELDLESMNRLFAGGLYGELNEVLNDKLGPYLPYCTLTSNFTPEFQRWIEVAYWAAQYDRVLLLAEAMPLTADSEYADKRAFFVHLAQLEQGNEAAMTAFIATPEGQRIYPEGSAPRLYIDALHLQREKQYVPAIRTAALMIALHSRDADWMPKAELLCEEIYFQLGMPESAKAVQADINEFYSDPEIQQQAAAIAAGK